MPILSGACAHVNFEKEFQKKTDLHSNKYEIKITPQAKKKIFPLYLLSQLTFGVTHLAGFSNNGKTTTNSKGSFLKGRGLFLFK